MTVTLTVDEVLDLILSAAKAKRLAKMGSRRRCLRLVAGPWRSSCNPCLQECVFAKSPAYFVEGEYHGNHSEWKEQNERNHVERPCGEDLAD